MGLGGTLGTSLHPHNNPESPAEPREGMTLVQSHTAGKGREGMRPSWHVNPVE